ncbi:D-2-hydroxyacid dehydrogenase family protein [Burkholderia thailandensis]|uniref:D-isomer specific 2-hydroxyacid dehydrogenase, NAD binding domain protein n=2 Tax=Burkholderia thailandensis TaxID=57975 RepID=A0AAW9D6F9_BURTH|nr:D-2-hydroxyacid dehydrogenase family protein [Burkholderia thailandensis]ABC36791.1 glyoxylate reductase [Burkholderia thailandensis E264]AHI65380.1 putative d-3-phosphoglycerate dehydrogenase oxidoreductase protein [Burkholderia thailandensis H0587]AHI74671.1 putative d-3-phosphoglycerate dehydrogenase oxidoreductase protein [Burkholderia thailandensis 2002721723]AHI79426.1 putative d-3-phosphoglycerate dehydrogenase oxidoreductase protein [Burkholderia thailandensis E444]AIC88663.1 putati
MKIAILDDYQDAVRKLNCFEMLADHEVKIFNNTVRGLGQLASRLAEVEALVLIRERTHITSQLLGKLPHLRMISQTGRVSTHIDLDACTERGIAVLEGAGSPIAPAELTWALIMAAQRRIPQYVANLKQGAWQQSGLKTSAMPPNFGLGQVLRGQTLGIWGYGKIGRLVAGYGKAFGMNVLVWGREHSLEAARADGHATAESREAFFEQADVLSLHLRLHDDTRGIVKLDDLLRMKPTSLLVNTSRAELLEENALVSALARNRPGMVAIDVYESEPILQGYSLLRMENVICTPHIGYVERESYELYFGAAFKNILAFDAGDLSSVANPEALNQGRVRR